LRATGRLRSHPKVSRYLPTSDQNGYRWTGTPLRETRTTADRADAGRFPLFAATWALAALFHTEYHFLAYRQAALTPKLTALLVTAPRAPTVWRPSVGALTALAVAELLDVAVLLPEVPNHWLLAGLVSLAWLLGRIGAGRDDGEALLARVRPPLLVAVALWTGFWKCRRRRERHGTHRLDRWHA